MSPSPQQRLVHNIWPAVQDVSLRSPHESGRHKISIQAVNKTPFSRAFLGKGQALNFSPEDALFPVYCSARFFSLSAKYVFFVQREQTSLWAGIICIH